MLTDCQPGKQSEITSKASSLEVHLSLAYVQMITRGSRILEVHNAQLTDFARLLGKPGSCRASLRYQTGKGFYVQVAVS